MSSSINQGRYTSVPLDEPRFEEQRRLQARPESLLMTQITSLAWLAAAIGLWYYADIYRVLTTDPRLNMLAYRIALLAIGTLLTIMFYLAGYHSFLRGLKDDYLDFAPRLIYLATFCFVTSYITLIIAVWPVWRWMSLVIVTVNTVAFIFSPNLVPSCFCPARSQKDE